MARSPIGALRRLRTDAEDGFTLVELTLSLLVMGIVLAAALSVLFSVQRTFEREAFRSQSNDQARLAVEELDREIRSGNLLYDPSTESVPYMSLRIYTQVNATTRQPGNRCMQWLIQGGNLWVRDWSPAWQDDGSINPWHVVAQNVVNQTVNPQVKAFVLDADPGKGGRAVQITIVTNASSVGGNNVTIQQEVTGRDTEYGYPNSVCKDIPGPATP